MEEKKNTIIDWIKEHKKQLIIAGVSITVILGVIIGIKKQDELERAFKSLKGLVEKTPMSVNAENNKVVSTVSRFGASETLMEKAVDTIAPISRAPHDVSGHPRNLPDGWKASADKLKIAAEKGIELADGQTWVDAYRTGANVA